MAVVLGKNFARDRLPLFCAVLVENPIRLWFDSLGTLDTICRQLLIVFRESIHVFTLCLWLTQWIVRFITLPEQAFLPLTQPAHHFSMVLGAVADLARSKSDLIAENARLRQQLIVVMVNNSVHMVNDMQLHRFVYHQ
jgi:hypothetical protein